MNPLEYLASTAEESIAVKKDFVAHCAADTVAAAQLIGQAIQAGGKILIFGNGGSAADAQHMAAEMVGRMLTDRRPLPAIALTTDTSNLTALANDFAFDEVFQKQVEALAKAEDVVIAISTSGKSKNVLKAVEAARSKGCKVIALTGGEGGPLAKTADVALNVKLGKNSSRIQETHIFAIHSMVDLLDRFFLNAPFIHNSTHR